MCIGICTAHPANGTLWMCGGDAPRCICGRKSGCTYTQHRQPQSSLPPHWHPSWCRRGRPSSYVNHSPSPSSSLSKQVEMRWPPIALALFLVLLVGALSANLLGFNSPNTTSASSITSFATTSFQWLWNILRGVGGGRESWAGVDGSFSFGPNISACHPSFTDAGAPIDCCPLIPDASQVVVDFKLPDLSSVPVRVRRPAHLIHDEEYIAKYQQAVAIMKSLPPTHPHNFMRQANVHCIYCTGAYDQLNSSYAFKIHLSWYFFPWHRAFLYFHERIVGKLVGDDSFALPYWQWDHPDGMYIPNIFLNGSLNHHERDEIHLPPTITDNNYMEVERGLSPADQIASNLNLLYTQMVSGAKKPELFMGCRLHPGEEDLCNGPGNIESAPHNTLHTWVGSGYNPEREDLGAFYSAARDPIFYAHHSNIDRLWMVWRSLHDNKLEITDELWLNTHFYFYDENLVLNRVKVRDFVDVSKLGYRYEEATMPWLKARPQPAVDPKIARAILNQRRLTSGLTNPLTVDRYAKQQVDFGPEGRLLTDNVTVEVPRPKQQRLHRKLGEDKEEEVLVVYGIETKRDTYTKFDVYVNAVDEEAVIAAGPRAREFAGTFVGMRRGVTVVRKGGSSSEGAKTKLKLGISELLRSLEAEDDESIWVTLVPEGSTGTTAVVGGVRIEFMGR